MPDRSYGPKTRFGGRERARRDPVQVAEAQQREHGEMCARRLAADHQPPCVVGEQPQRRVLAVVGRRRKRMLRREPILDADRREARRPRDLLEQQILAVRRAERPTATVEMQVGAARILGLDDAERDLASAPRESTGCARARRRQVAGTRRCPSRRACRVTDGGSVWTDGCVARIAARASLNVRVSASISASVIADAV